MKKLAVICLLIGMPVLAHAGNFDIALGAGAVRNTSPLGDNFMHTQGGNTSLSATLRFLYNINRNWQVGISLGYVPLSYSSQVYPMVYGDLIYPGPHTNTKSVDYYANPAVPMQVEANYKFPLGKFEIYSGISAGYFAVYDPLFGDFVTEIYRPYNTAGFVGGIQAGGNWFFTKWSALNLQMAVSYYEPYSIMAFPVTAGIRFRL